MKIEPKEITIRELTEGYQDSGDEGVVGYGGRLDIRPPYQREFIYTGAQREAVIDTVTKNYPLNVMYWAVREDDTFEIIDGQQRTISICQFVKGDFSFQSKYFLNRPADERGEIMNYKLMVYFCSGTDSERLAWFQTINIAGEELTNQELRNAVYAGSWVNDAKRYFSKSSAPARSLANKYLSGTAIRQEYLETAIKWMVDSVHGGNGKVHDDQIRIYMAKHQHESSAVKLWTYFHQVISWVQAMFPTYRKEMKGIAWGNLYNRHKDDALDPSQMEQDIARLMQDEDIEKKSGIYTYLLTGEERHLNLRSFNDNHKREAYERQKGICTICKKRFEISEMEADHITPWHEGGKTIPENCQMLCRDDNRRKGGK